MNIKLKFNITSEFYILVLKVILNTKRLFTPSNGQYITSYLSIKS